MEMDGALLTHFTNHCLPLLNRLDHELFKDDERAILCEHAENLINVMNDTLAFKAAPGLSTAARKEARELCRKRIDEVLKAKRKTKNSGTTRKKSKKSEDPKKEGEQIRLPSSDPPRSGSTEQPRAVSVEQEKKEQDGEQPKPDANSS